MKKIIFILSFFILTNAVAAKDIRVSETLVINGQVVSQSNECVIIQTIDEDGNLLFWVVSEIFNAFLPDMVNYVCLEVAGENNQEICEGISNGISFITSALDVGKTSYKLFKSLLNLTAERGAVKSGLYFTTESLELAYNVKSTLEAYKKLGIIKWNNISFDEAVNEANRYVGSVYLYNTTNTIFYINISLDGVTWETKALRPRKSYKINFWDGYLKQNYGFIKGDKICNYQIFTDKTYKIKFDSNSKKYFIL
ncbi:hypothetical protein [Phnomibacter sp. MR]|uniref:hypothetical protein n=1 Tax=Phnomibacter sp. MR TaxID=3042318 RepID=UPI003A7FFB33